MSEPPAAPRLGLSGVVPASPESIAAAAELIRSGALVGLPTETVYGLAADAANPAAVAAIYAAKGRPRFNPLIAHVSDLAMAEHCATFTPLARRLAERFWPGPLTLVLPRAKDCPVCELASAGLDTIAIRIPKNAVALELIARVGGPLAAPSANPSEALSPTRAEHVAEALGDRVALVLDAGPCQAGLESTIIHAGVSPPLLLRPGALARVEIESITGPLGAPEAGSKTLAPGMLRRHYAPRARLRLDAARPAPGEAYLGFGPAEPGVSPDLNLSPSGDLTEAAANLFAMLRELDARASAIAIAPIPDEGLGEAINDRIKRAADVFGKDGV